MRVVEGCNGLYNIFYKKYIYATIAKLTSIFQTSSSYTITSNFSIVLQSYSWHQHNRTYPDSVARSGYHFWVHQQFEISVFEAPTTHSWSWALLEKLPIVQYSRTSQHFMEPDGSLLCSQEPSTGPYPQPDQSNPYHPIPSKSHFNIVTCC
jgi:hypothetical protein